ncbi:MAG: hypothetical protein RLY49_294 [Candidatus Parcubacteria bacterium]|jgi:hypothetical protein
MVRVTKIKLFLGALSSYIQNSIPDEAKLQCGKVTQNKEHSDYVLRHPREGEDPGTK